MPRLQAITAISRIHQAAAKSMTPDPSPRSIPPITSPCSNSYQAASAKPPSASQNQSISPTCPVDPSSSSAIIVEAPKTHNHNNNQAPIDSNQNHRPPLSPLSPHLQ
ncbi:hypothetical protein M0R45_036552 [Rubus argutus]|uniref:Uncharacterized protein n=1 Tax=Rubus argutus TaxID=59490 RepID=A0AAW1VZZ6_RUBAR